MRDTVGFQHGSSTVHQVTLLIQDTEDSFFVWEEGRRCVCRSHSSLRHCMASRPRLQTTAIVIWQAHDPHDHGADWQSQLHPYPPVTTNEAGYEALRTPSLRDPSGTHSFQHLWPANHRIQKVCIRRRPRKPSSTTKTCPFAASPNTSE